MHLNMRAIRIVATMTLPLMAVATTGPVLAQQADQEKAVQSQPDPHTPPPAQPIDPGKAAAREAQDKALEQMKKANEPAKPKNGAGSTAAPRNRTMQFSLPPLVAIAEVPRGKAVMIQGQVLSPQPTTFVLNDGNASMVINLGPDWRQLSKVKAGDRIGVIGQMDPYGSPLFRATGIVLDTGRIIVIPNG
jgi:hypothetical protein